LQRNRRNHVVIGIIVVGDAMIALARSRGEVGAIQHR
jgi:hypothetical protein